MSESKGKDDAASHPVDHTTDTANTDSNTGEIQPKRDKESHDEPEVEDAVKESEQEKDQNDDETKDNSTAGSTVEPTASEHVGVARGEGVGAERTDNERADNNGDTASETKDASAEDSEDEGIEGSEELDAAARDSLYERGLQLEARGKPRLALKCYLQCLKGLSGGAEFSFLPQCLRKVADLYFQQDELEKAIQFIQAEKMYFETALIDTTDLQKKVEDRQKLQDAEPERSSDPHFANPDTVRADEFENLARLCLEKKESQLALEYQGKATRLRQKLYGDAHEVTRRSLDFFTVIYGEVGKQQYSESMQKLTKATEGGSGEEPKAETPDAGESQGSPPGSPQSILRKRKELSKARLKKRVSFHEPANAREQREQEEWISKALLWILFMLCLLLLVIIFHYIYCKLDPQCSYCSTLRTDLYYYYMRFKYAVYYYTRPQEDDVELG